MPKTMSVGRRFLGWLILTAAVLAASTSRGAAPVDGHLGPITIEAWSSAVTVLQPEVHVLLRNDSDEPVEFMLQFALGVPNGGIRCNPDQRGLSDGLVTKLSRRSRAALKATLGTVPARGWTHRSFLAGLSGGGAPCRVPYRLTVRDATGGESRLEGTIEAPQRDAMETGLLADSDLHLESIVEQDRTTLRAVSLVRVLARNTGNVSASIGISGIRFQCPTHDQPTQELHSTTVQGEDVGPMVLPPTAVHVFVIGINVPAGLPLSDCRGVVDVSAFEKDGMRHLTNFTFDLEPRGSLELGGHGFRITTGSPTASGADHRCSVDQPDC